MQPIKPLIIYTVRAYGPDGDNEKASFLAPTVNSAIVRYANYKHITNVDGYKFGATPARCNDKPVTEVHCLKYGTKFRLVHKGGISRGFDNDEYAVKSQILTKYDYTPINRTYLCIDGEGNKRYVDAYEWCITEEV